MTTAFLTGLEAEQEIHRVPRRYCRPMDGIDRPLGCILWHDDGLADYGPIFKGTGRSISLVNELQTTEATI